jgi:hypothetical protein
VLPPPLAPDLGTRTGSPAAVWLSWPGAAEDSPRPRAAHGAGGPGSGQPPAPWPALKAPDTGPASAGSPRNQPDGVLADGVP